LGQYTIADLRDLIAAKDAEMKAIAASFAAFKSTWESADPSAAKAWEEDWLALAQRYIAARESAEIVLAASHLNPVPESLSPAQEAYIAILRALQAQDRVTSPGDATDLAGRLVDAGAALHYEVPQPLAQDWDLTAIRATDKAVDYAKGVAKKVADTLPTVGIAVGALGLLAAFLLLRK